MRVAEWQSRVAELQWGGVRRDAELQCYRQTKVESFRITELQYRVTELKGIHWFREMRGYKNEESQAQSAVKRPFPCVAGAT